MAVRWGAGGYLRINAQTSAAAVVGPTDPFFASVVLLAGNDNAANGTTTFIDQSGSAHALTRNGSAIYDGSSAPAGMSTSVSCPANTDYLSCASGTDFNFTTGDMTAECFMLCPISIPGFGALFDSGNWRFVMVFNSTPTALRLELNASQLGTSSAHNMVAGNWYHVAYSRSGGNFNIYVGGTRILSQADSTNIGNGTGPTFPFSVTGGQGINSNICSLRITKGVGRYTGATITPPTLPLPTS